MTRASREAGLTLTELMVVLVIVAILGALSVASLRNQKVGDSARQVASVMQEARRKAVAAGPIPAGEIVPAQTGMVAANPWRAFVAYTNDPAGQTSKAELFTLQDCAPTPCTATWVSMTVANLPVGAKATEIWTVSNAAAIDATTLLPGETTGTINKGWYADGSADSHTVFISKRGSNPNSNGDGEHYSIVVMQVSGFPTTFPTW